MSTIDELRQARIKKLEKIRELGIDPYPASFPRKETVQKTLEMLGRKVSVAGRLRAIREHGGSTFADLEDQNGRIQLFFSREELKGRYDFLKLLDIGDIIGVSGKVFQTQAGQTTVKVADFTLLTKSIRPLPEKWHGLVDIETCLRKRYLDLIMNPEVREMFVKKAKFWQAVREYLTKKGFLEVETPVLEAVPGGADARPFITHHNALDIDLYLRISLELHLKRLMVGGFDKVFEIGRVFRNEGVDAEHLQDYTSMEFYWGYADYKQLMDFLEDFYQFVVKETTGGFKTTREGKEIDWSGKWPRWDYVELFREKAGIDPLKASLEELYKKAQELKLKPEKNLGRGRLMDMIYKKTIRPTLIQPSFLINLPVDISPLAKRLPEVPRLTQRFLVMVGGTELGNGFSELNDPIDQRERFVEQQRLREKGDEEAQMYDADFIEALEYGMPPTAGFGMSERVFSFLMDKPIRETVFFPTMRPEE
ncbi:MAG TPA: lysine--tRNA ligase [Patescibacteria group bacterium]|nr:lysine--tRNA ligase [Patescibacteria group bacterium]